MKLQLENSKTTLVLSKFWKLSLDDWSPRLGIQDRFGQNGVYVTGDKKISRRKITLRGDITGMTDAEYDAQTAELEQIFYNDHGPFFLIDVDRGYRAQIELEKMSNPYTEGLEKRVASVTLSLIMLAGTWETAGETTVSWLNVASGATNVISNPGAVDLYPIIEVSTLLDNPEFSIINRTTQDRITIGSNLFTESVSIEIDCIRGTVYLNDGISKVEISSAIADGTGFIYFDFGDNEIEYQSIYSNANIIIKYRPRRIF